MLGWLKQKFNYGRSSKWSTVRKNHLKDQSTCQSCGKKDNLEVHHIIPYHLDPSKELEPTNLITLCKTCHLLFGHLMDYKSWNVNVASDCEAFRHKIENRPYNVNNITDNNSWFDSFFKY